VIRESFQIPPFSFLLDGVKVTIYEVLKHKFISGDTWYYVTVRLQSGNFKSRIFGVDARDEEDLKKKLLVEISKLKLLRYTEGEKGLAEVVGG